MSDADIEALQRKAVVALQLGDLRLAAALCKQVLEFCPENTDAWFRLGRIGLEKRDYALAAEYVSNAIRLNPEAPNYHFVMAIIRQDQNRLSDAIVHLECAVALAPTYVEALNNLGLIQLDVADAVTAARSFRRAIELKPGYSGAWNHLGIALRAIGDSQGALGCFQRAVELSPDLVDARVNCGIMLLASGQPRAALSVLEEALKLNPRLANTQYRIALCHSALGSLNSSHSALREALRLDDKHGEARCMLARELALLGQFRESISLYEAELRQRPYSLQASLGWYLTVPYVYSSLDELETARLRAIEGMRLLVSEKERFLTQTPEVLMQQLEWSNFFLAYQGKDDRSFQEVYGRFVNHLLSFALPEYLLCLPKPEIKGRRIRIGFVSSFFRRCTVGQYFRRWVSDIDPEYFEVHVYRLGSKSDDVTAEINSSCEHAVQLSGTLAEMAQRLRTDSLDILVFPEIGMESRTFLLAALRLAPVQCAAWGHPVTSGLTNMDYFLSCETMEPPLAQKHYSEKLIKLPGIGTCYERPRLPGPGLRADFGLPEDKTLYLFPHSLFKIHPDNDVLLARILLQDPQGVLVLCQDRHAKITNQFLARLDAMLASHGLAVDERRIVLPSLSHDEYLRLNLLCDLMLDSLFWSGGNTSLDALACCLPVVTLPGEMMRSRQSMAMLGICGLSELVAGDAEEYIRIAVQLGRDSERRASVREKLRKPVDRIFNDDTPIRSLEAFFFNVIEGAV